ncbi:hypothetical protein PL321_11015 [Caloramator sp. mosi_1]|uniref:hypothetical protein n=1 Tax=Caloramator sp. mosi_1 TaxID=3023090 RepID=UPI0023613B5A|nr:hypothetical protein [Caloramator sp. mosi_1]WDC83300.1 hypothetical protein PL321_11015 [Caloramator sp. mosi_1]
MIDLGYHEVEGIYLFVDNHYVTSYISEQNALKNNQTYTIEVQDALFYFMQMKNLKKL